MPRSQIFIRLGPCAEAALGIGIVIGTVEGKGEVQAGGGVALRARGSRRTMAAARGPLARADASADRGPGSEVAGQPCLLSWPAR